MFVTIITRKWQISNYKLLQIFLQYISELSLLEAEPTLGILPSEISAGCIAIAKYNLEEEPWSPELTQITGYKLKELEKTIEFLNLLYTKASGFAQQAIQEKYKHGKYLHVATLTPKNLEIKYE